MIKIYKGFEQPRPIEENDKFFIIFLSDGVNECQIGWIEKYLNLAEIHTKLPDYLNSFEITGHRELSKRKYYKFKNRKLKL